MKLLLVDDDTGVIQALLATLKALPGHEVRVATSGAKGLENAAAMGGVDVLIADVVMQPMDGFALRDALLARHPRMRTIFISGFDLSDYGEQTQGHQLLAKPVDIGALVAAVQTDLSALAQPAGGGMPVARTVAVGQPRATPSAGPRAPSPAAPRAVAAAPPAVAAAQPPVESPAPAPAVDSEPDAAPPADREALIGQMLGTYQVTSYLGEGENGSAYAAVQSSINRRVVLKILDPARRANPALLRQFAADARAKANVQHPSILPVFEAGEAAGYVFYAREFVDGQNLAELQASGGKITEPTALKIMRVVADGLAYLGTSNVRHTPLEAADIYLGNDGQPRLANRAVQISAQSQSVEQQMQTLGRIILSVLPPAQGLSVGIRALLGRMAQAPTSGLNSWPLLLQGLKALEPKSVTSAAASIGARDRATEEAMVLARKQQKRSVLLTALSFTTLFAIVVFVVLKYVVFSNERTLDGEVQIPAGTYTLANGKSVTITAPFSIDTYEVTFAKYGRFLDHLEKNPTADQDFRHPRMPRYLTHRPEHWDIYYLRAKAGQPVRSIPIDLNCPVVTITWWDAYAYAHWLGRELPTADEWEVAASGGKGQPYPWGAEPIAKRANSGVDHIENAPSAKGKVDGYNFWNPVDAIKTDKSPFGVVGTAGNVAEWTDTWTDDKTFPIIKGGSYRTMDARLDQQIANQDASKGDEWIGFRTVRRNATK